MRSRTFHRGPYLRSGRINWDLVQEKDRYPFNLPAIATLDTITFHPQVTFLVGENGSGKSTLLESLAVSAGFNAEGGSRNFHFETTERSRSVLADVITLVREPSYPQDGFFLRAESFYNVASEIDRLNDAPGGGDLLQSYGGVSLHEQSHGESFLSLFLHRFGGHGLYFLDEPESALSPKRQLALLRRIDELVAQGSQFIIATHSPILLSYPKSRITSVSQEGLVEMNLADTEHFAIYHRVINDGQSYIASILS